MTFKRPPAGDYRVETDEELIEGLSFAAYRRVSTVIFLPGAHPGSWEMLVIDPKDLAAAHDARPLRAARSRNGPTPEMICPCSAQNDGLHFFTKSHQASIQISEDVWPHLRLWPWLGLVRRCSVGTVVCTENLIRIDYVTERPTVVIKNWMLLTLLLSALFAGAIYWVRGHIEYDAQRRSMLPTAIAHGSVLLGFFFVVKAWSYGLDRYLLLYHDNGVVVGASYTWAAARAPRAATRPRRRAA